MGRHTKTTGYTHHHTKYTKHHTERETTISSQLLLVMAGSVFHFDSHRAALYIHFYLHTYMTKKLEKRLYILDFENEIGKNKKRSISCIGIWIPLSYSNCGRSCCYRYHLPSKLLQYQCDALTLLCNNGNEQVSGNVCLMITCYEMGGFYSSLRITHAFRYPNLLKHQTQRNSTQYKQKLTIVCFMGIRFSLWNSNKLDLSVCMHALCD